MTTLAIDLGTTTGWAIQSATGWIVSGMQSFKTQRFEGGGMRFLRFQKALDCFLETQGTIDAVYFEEVRRHAGVDAAHVYGGLMATLTSWCEHRQIPYQGIAVGTWKKLLTGKGNAGKQDVIDAVKAKGFDPGDDNEADAIGILLCAVGIDI